MRACLVGISPKSNLVGNDVGFPLPLSILHLVGYAVQRAGFDQKEISYKGFYSTDEDSLIIEWILSQEPNLIGFSVYAWNSSRVFSLCQAIKELRPEVRIIVGGPEVTTTPTDILRRHPALDFVCIGEGEITLVDLLRTLEQGMPLHSVQGIAWRANGEVVMNIPRPPVADLEQMRFSWSMFREELRGFAAAGQMRYEASRGCPFVCRYCSWDVSGIGRRLRLRSLDQVREDFGIFFRLPQLQIVTFCDADILLPPAHAKGLLRILIEENGAREESGMAPVGIAFSMNPEHLDEELLELLRDSCFSSNVYVAGLQTVYAGALEASGRVLHKERYAERFRRFRSTLSGRAILELICGLPGDHYEGFRESIDYALRLEPDALVIHPFVVVPGSEFAISPGKYGIEHDPKPPYEVIRTASWSEEELGLAKKFGMYVQYLYGHPTGVRKRLDGLRVRVDCKPIDIYEEFFSFLSARGYSFEPRPTITDRSAEHPHWLEQDQELIRLLELFERSKHGARTRVA